MAETIFNEYEGKLSIIVDKDGKKYAIHVIIEDGENNEGDEVVYLNFGDGVDFGLGFEEALEELLEIDVLSIMEDYNYYTEDYSRLFDSRRLAKAALKDIYEQSKPRLQSLTYEKLCEVEGGEISEFNWDELEVKEEEED